MEETIRKENLTVETKEYCARTEEADECAMLSDKAEEGLTLPDKTDGCAAQTPCPKCIERAQTAETECGCRIRHRSEKEYRDLMNRLKRIEGQVRGILGMVEEERYCVDILTQVMAVQSALNSFNKALLSNHIKTCVVDDILAGSGTAVDELCSTIQKLMK